MRQILLENINLWALIIFGLYWYKVNDKKEFFNGFWMGWILYEIITLLYNSISYYYILLFSAFFSILLYLIKNKLNLKNNGS